MVPTIQMESFGICAISTTVTEPLSTASMATLLQCTTHIFLHASVLPPPEAPTNRSAHQYLLPHAQPPLLLRPTARAKANHTCKLRQDATSIETKATLPKEVPIEVQTLLYYQLYEKEKQIKWYIFISKNLIYKFYKMFKKAKFAWIYFIIFKLHYTKYIWICFYMSYDGKRHTFN